MAWPPCCIGTGEGIQPRPTLTLTLTLIPTLIPSLTLTLTPTLTRWGNSLAFPYSYDWRAPLLASELERWKQSVRSAR